MLHEQKGGAGMYDFRTTRIYYSELSVQLGGYTATLDYAGCDEPAVWNTIRHSHTNYELHIISRGSGTLITDAGRFMISAGTIYLTGPGVYHSQYSGKDDPMDECALRFNLEPRPQQSSDRELTALIKKLVDEPFFFRQGGEDCRQLIGEIMSEAGMGLPGYREKTAGYFSSLLINLGRYAAGSRGKPLPENRTIKVGKIDLRAMLDTYFFGSVDFAAPERITEDLHITRRHLSRLMRQYYGMTYVDKINELRCEYAKELLRDDLIPISRIWSAVGYKSQQYFSRVFRKLVGMTPSEYRARSRYTNR